MGEALPCSLSFTLGLPEAGFYQLDVTGTGDGPYTITLETLDDEGQVISQEMVTGEASQGSLFTQKLILGGSGVINASPGVYLPILSN